MLAFYLFLLYLCNMIPKKITYSLVFLLLITCRLNAAVILIPMDDSQRNHLKSYGIAYWVLTHDVEVQWLLNYRGGSFMFQHSQLFEREIRLRGVSFQVLADIQADRILQEIARDRKNEGYRYCCFQ